MQRFLPRGLPRLPSPAQLIAPVVGVERSVKSALMTPLRLLNLPEPDLPGPAEIVEGVARQLPEPPQLPRLS